MSLNLTWFGYITRLSRGEGGDLLVQIISTCRHWLTGGGREPEPCSAAMCRGSA
jgi:hypothetical protein